jgi:hypothetical protein
MDKKDRGRYSYNPGGHSTRRDEKVSGIMMLNITD